MKQMEDFLLLTQSRTNKEHNLLQFPRKKRLILVNKLVFPKLEEDSITNQTEIIKETEDTKEETKTKDEMIKIEANTIKIAHNQDKIEITETKETTETTETIE